MKITKLNFDDQCSLCVKDLVVGRVYIRADKSFNRGCIYICVLSDDTKAVINLSNTSCLSVERCSDAARFREVHAELIIKRK